MANANNAFSTLEEMYSTLLNDYCQKVVSLIDVSDIINDDKAKA